MPESIPHLIIIDIAVVIVITRDANLTKKCLSGDRRDQQQTLKSEPDVTVVDEISSGCNLQYLIIIECNAPDHTSHWYSVHRIAQTVQQTIRR